MRIATRSQLRLDCTPISQVQLNTNCRDEMIPFLRALQHVYSEPKLCDEILELISHDVNGESSADVGRDGLTYWQILVLAAARLELNKDYDALQDLAENHRNLRCILEVGDWEGRDGKADFNWERIRDNVCLVKEATLQKINALIVAEGHRLVPDAAEAVRGDTFVVAANIHYPTESSLIRDGVRKMIEVAVLLAALLGATGWRQHQHWTKKVKKLARVCDRISRSKGAHAQSRLQQAYRQLLEETEKIIERIEALEEQAGRTRGTQRTQTVGLAEKLAHYRQLTERVCDTAQRRVLEDEEVPNSEKLFSIFEPETQLFKRGKAGQPLQFGHLTLVVEDAAGFICHYKILATGEQESEIIVSELRALQKRLKGRIKVASLDRGFHSPENQKDLAKIIEHPCVPMKGKKQGPRQAEQASVQFRAARQRHPGVESAIGALQSGNGLARCRDHTYVGFRRYVGLGILGRNLHVLGKILLQREAPRCVAASSQRKAVAA